MSLKSRLEALEAAAWHRTRARSVSRVYINPDAAEQAEIEKARAAGRFVLVVRGEPYPIDPALLAIVDCTGEQGGLGSPKPDLTPVIRPGWFEM